MTSSSASTSTQPLFSVIVATYNRATLLRRALTSVLRQTCADFELIVVDDGSTDDTYQLLEEFHDKRILLVSQDNAGPLVARNTGAKVASGTYLVFLDDDDEALPEWLQQFASVICEERPAIVCCGVTYLDENGRIQSHRLPETLSRAFQSLPGLFLTGSYAVQRELFISAGGFASERQRAENTELAIRLTSLCVARGASIRAIERPLVRIHRHAPQPGHHHGKWSGAKYILEHHRDALRTDPNMHSTYETIVGVNAARFGHYSEARRHFRSALEIRPMNARNCGRFILAFFPLIAKRLWRPRERAPDAESAASARPTRSKR